MGVQDEISRQNRQGIGYESGAGNSREFVASVLVCPKCGEPVVGGRPTHVCGEWAKMVDFITASRKEQYYKDVIDMYHYAKQLSQLTLGGRHGMRVMVDADNAFIRELLELLKKLNVEFRETERQRKETKLVMEGINDSGFLVKHYGDELSKMILSYGDKSFPESEKDKVRDKISEILDDLRHLGASDEVIAEVSNSITEKYGDPERYLAEVAQGMKAENERTRERFRSMFINR